MKIPRFENSGDVSGYKGTDFRNGDEEVGKIYRNRDLTGQLPMEKTMFRL